MRHDGSEHTVGLSERLGGDGVVLGGVQLDRSLGLELAGHSEILGMPVVPLSSMRGRKL